MGTTISVTSNFNATAERIWGILGRIETLREIAKPYAFFTSLDDGKTEWKPGAQYRLELKVLGFIPMGVHKINVVQVNKEGWTIETHESGRLAKVWNHTIRLVPLADDTTKYTDTVFIEAGMLTLFVRLWSIMFYRHRQRKWKKILSA